ncbi:unnamed protein product [Amoebophrya sp. A120]|nr:unnamed protein product [Amoebophrya sp. A120]|eukprot:GSA120T00013861001.1
MKMASSASIHKFCPNPPPELRQCNFYLEEDAVVTCRSFFDAEIKPFLGNRRGSQSGTPDDINDHTHGSSSNIKTCPITTFEDFMEKAKAHRKAYWEKKLTSFYQKDAGGDTSTSRTPGETGTGRSTSSSSTPAAAGASVSIPFARQEQVKQRVVEQDTPQASKKIALDHCEADSALTAWPQHVGNEVVLWRGYDLTVAQHPIVGRATLDQQVEQLRRELVVEVSPTSTAQRATTTSTTASSKISSCTQNKVLTAGDEEFFYASAVMDRSDKVQGLLYNVYQFYAAACGDREWSVEDVNYYLHNDVSAAQTRGNNADSDTTSRENDLQSSQTTGTGRNVNSCPTNYNTRDIGVLDQSIIDQKRHRNISMTQELQNMQFIHATFASVANDIFGCKNTSLPLVDFEIVNLGGNRMASGKAECVRTSFLCDLRREITDRLQLFEENAANTRVLQDYVFLNVPIVWTLECALAREVAAALHAFSKASLCAMEKHLDLGPGVLECDPLFTLLAEENDDEEEDLCIVGADGETKQNKPATSTGGTTSSSGTGQRLVPSSTTTATTASSASSSSSSAPPNLKIPADEMENSGTSPSAYRNVARQLANQRRKLAQSEVLRFTLCRRHRLSFRYYFSSFLEPEDCIRYEKMYPQNDVLGSHGKCFSLGFKCNAASGVLVDCGLCYIKMEHNKKKSGTTTSSATDEDVRDQYSLKQAQFKAGGYYGLNEILLTWYFQGYADVDNSRLSGRIFKDSTGGAGATATRGEIEKEHFEAFLDSITVKRWDDLNYAEPFPGRVWYLFLRARAASDPCRADIWFGTEQEAVNFLEDLKLFAKMLWTYKRNLGKTTLKNNFSLDGALAKSICPPWLPCVCVVSKYNPREADFTEAKFWVEELQTVVEKPTKRTTSNYPTTKLSSNSISQIHPDLQNKPDFGHATWVDLAKAVFQTRLERQERRRKRQEVKKLLVADDHMEEEKGIKDEAADGPRLNNIGADVDVDDDPMEVVGGTMDCSGQADDREIDYIGSDCEEAGENESDEELEVPGVRDPIKIYCLFPEEEEDEEEEEDGKMKKDATLAGA